MEQWEINLRGRLDKLYFEDITVIRVHGIPLAFNKASRINYEVAQHRQFIRRVLNLMDKDEQR